MIEKAQNACIQIRCEQKCFKRAQVLKNLVVILKLNKRGQLLEQNSEKLFKLFKTEGGICNMFPVPVVTRSDATLLISRL